MPSSITKQTAIQIFGKTLSLILGLWVISLMTRAMGQAGFGEYTTVIAYLQVAGILADLGLTMTLARELGTGQINESTLTGNAISFRTITSGIVFLLAPTVALFLPYPPLIKLAIVLASLAFWAGSITQSLTAVFQAKQASSRLIITELMGRIILLIGTYIAVTQKFVIIQYIIVLIITNVITCGITLFKIKKLIHFNWQINFDIWQYLWHTTWPVGITIALNLIYFKADTLILSLYRSASEVGLYGAAYRVLEVLLMLPAIIGGLMLPLMANSYKKNNHDELTTHYHNILDSLLAAGLAVIIGVWMIGTPIIIWLAGVDFAVSGKILSILSVAVACIFIGNATGYTIFAIGKQKRMILAYATAAVLALTAYIMFIPSYSYWGAAWVTVGVEAFMAAVGIIILWHYNLRPSFVRWPKIILSTIALGLGLWIPLPLIAKIICGGVLYVVSLWGLKLLPPVIAREALADEAISNTSNHE